MFKGFIAIATIVSTIWFGGLKDQIEPATKPHKADSSVSKVLDAASEGQKGLNSIFTQENQKHLKNGLSGNFDPSK